MQNTSTQDKKRTFLDNFATIKTLSLMQLKEKMDLSFLGNFKKTLFKTIWTIVEFAVVAVVCYFVFYFAGILGVFSLIGDVPTSVMTIVFTLMMALSLVSTTAGLVKSLYFSKDNSVLLTLPVTPSLVFLSKLVVYYVYELRKNFMFIVPMFLAYGFFKGMVIWYYPWMLFLFVFVSVLPVLLSALLSIPCMYVYQLIRKVQVIQYILYAVLAGGLIALGWYLIGLIPANINFVETWGTTFWEIQAFLEGFTKTFTLMHAFTTLIVGKTQGLRLVLFDISSLWGALILIATTALLLVLCFVLAKPLFYRMASKPFEFSKDESITGKKNVKTGGFLSALLKEIKIGIRGNSFIKHGAIVVVVLPMAIALLNKMYSAMNTRFLGMQMTVAFNLMVVLLILLLTNIDMASAYSRDGSTAYLNKVQPTSYAKILFAKLVMNLLITLVGVILTTVVFSTYSSMSPINNVLFGVVSYLVYACHLFWSAETDLMNPQYAQYATFNEQANNPNENTSVLLLFILSLIFFVLALFFGLEDATSVFVKLTFVAAALTVFKVYTYFTKIKLYYKEKQ